MKTATFGGAALVIGFDGRRLFRAEAATANFQPNGWIRIDTQGAVTLTLGKSEMGQGVRTALPMILADELGADWSRVQIVQAMPGPDFKRLGTGGNGSVQGSWKPLREAAAAAREMLIQAAAKEWQIDSATCTTEAGAVRHAESGRTTKFGRLVEAAAKLPVPQTRALKKPGDFRLIGKRTPRVDAREIVTGATLSVMARLSSRITPTSKSRGCATRPSSKRTSSRAISAAPSEWVNLPSRRLLLRSRTPSSPPPGNAFAISQSERKT